MAIRPITPPTTPPMIEGNGAPDLLLSPPGFSVLVLLVIVDAEVWTPFESV